MNALELGTETGSLVNHVLSAHYNNQVEVGMPATILGWTDRKPATVIKVFQVGKCKAFTIQADLAVRIDSRGMSDTQTYEFKRDPEGITRSFKVEKDGIKGIYLNSETNRWKKSGERCIVGRREKYHDYSF